MNTKSLSKTMKRMKFNDIAKQLGEIRKKRPKESY